MTLKFPTVSKVHNFEFPDVIELHYFELHPPLVATRVMAFGFVYENDNEFDDDYSCSLHRLSMCTTPLPNSEYSIRPEFMLPSIYVYDEFHHALNYSHYLYATLKSSENFSDYIVVLDGGKVLWLVSWKVCILNNGIFIHFLALP